MALAEHMNVLDSDNDGDTDGDSDSSSESCLN